MFKTNLVKDAKPNTAGITVNIMQTFRKSAEVLGHGLDGAGRDVLALYSPEILGGLIQYFNPDDLTMRGKMALYKLQLSEHPDSYRYRLPREGE